MVGKAAGTVDSLSTTAKFQSWVYQDRLKQVRLRLSLPTFIFWAGGVKGVNIVFGADLTAKLFGKVAPARTENIRWCTFSPRNKVQT